MKRMLRVLVLLLTAVAISPVLAFGPGDPPPGITAFSGGPVALDLLHDRIFLCDSANNRVLVYDFSGRDGYLGDTPLAVLGQFSINATALNGVGDVAPNGCGLAHPDGIVYDATRDGLWVCDYLNNRVLFFSTRQLRSFQPADYVIGQTSFGNADARAGRRGLYGPSGLALSADGQQLFVADKLNNRVLAFDVRNMPHYPAALAVVGQQDFWEVDPGTSERALFSPSGLALDSAGQLYVADTGNNRVLLFDASAMATGAAAYAVMGQQDFTSADAAAGIGGMRAPTTITLDDVGQWVFIADTGNHRVLAFDGQSQNPLSAAAIVGQPDVDSGAPQPANKGLDDPVGIVFDIVDRKLWVSETGNARAGFYRLE